MQPPRKLTSEEKARVKELIAKFESGQDEHFLEELRPFGEVGDKTAIQAIMLGYDNLHRYLPHERRVPLAGLWAVAYWESVGPSRDAARLIDNCIAGFNGTFTGKGPARDCGFDVEMPGRLEHGFDAYWQKRGGAPTDVQFVQRSLTPGGEQDRARFDRLVSLLRGGGEISTLDRTWAKEYADGAGPEPIATLQAAIDGHPAAVARLQAVNAEIFAEYRARDLERWEAFRKRETLTPAELETYERLSSQLGPEYITEFGRKYVIYGETRIAQTCAVDRGVCDMQRALFEERRERVLAEARARNAPIESWGDQLFVDVRVYDANGNFVGTQTVTRTEAETLQGR